MARNDLDRIAYNKFANGEITLTEYIKYQNSDKIMEKKGAMKILKDFRDKSALFSVRTALDIIIPELKESEDEKVRKALIEMVHDTTGDELWGDYNVHKEDALAWLEKQDEAFTRKDVDDAYLKGMCDTKHELEKQGEHQQLYIRFGDIPTNEKSKIYSGEQEIGSENGVSVYPAFKSTNGSIILGLNLPITKTTLHTQQYLLEYDNRPCYLVTGDYIGKDTDGQILISNVNIIEKIDNYRVKTEKQCGQKETLCDKCRKTQPSHSCQDITALGRCAVEHEQKSDNKVEPKFKKGDWVILTAGELSTTLQIVNVDTKKLYWFNDSSYLPIVDEECLRHWTLQDAKDGDVLFAENFDNIGGCVFIFKGLDSWKFDAEGDRAIATGYCCVSITESGNTYFGIQGPDCVEIERVHPATKEQRDTLFTKMKEAGYEWSDKDRKLIKVEDEPNHIDWLINVEVIDGEKKELKKIEQTPAWSEEDELMLLSVIQSLELTNGAAQIKIDWLKSLKRKIGQGLDPDKVIEWLRYHIQVDEPKIEYNEDGQPLAESFIAHAEARCMAADKVIERFKKDFKL